MRIYKSFFRFEKCRKACKYRLYRLMRTYKEIVKNYILIYNKCIIHLFIGNVNKLNGKFGSFSLIHEKKISFYYFENKKRR